MITLFQSLARAAILLSTPLAVLGGDLIPGGSDWKLFKGTSEPPSAQADLWREEDYDDGAWTTAQAPVFYGVDSPGTALPDMRGAYSSVFLRKSFQLANPFNFGELRLNATSDDGFIAWINGAEVARFNAPTGNPAFNSTAGKDNAAPAAQTTYSIPAPSRLLLAGVNVLAVQAFNSSAANPDFLFEASLTGVADTSAPVAEEIIPAPGEPVRELLTVEVKFDKPVKGIEGGDLLLNGQPAKNVTEFAEGDFVFTFDPPAAGEVTVAWRDGHGITDKSDAANPFAGGSWSYQFQPVPPAPKILITEFMASNKKTLHDEDGDSSDWIELYNSESTAVSLEGWFLTDATNSLAKWQFPAVVMESKAYLVVFASQKDRTNLLDGKLHTNFKLASDAGYVALVSPLTNVVSEFGPAYPKQQTDVSYGRAEGAPLSQGYFTKPTPGAANSTSGPGFSADVDFSATTRTFTNAFDLLLTTSSAKAVIRYTLDGNLPTNNSPIYTGALRITNSVQVRARTYEDGLFPGAPRTEAFLMLSNNLLSFTSTLPVLVIHSLGKGSPNATTQTPVELTLFEPVGGSTSLTNPPTMVTRGAVKLRGSSTEGLAKPSYATELWDEFNGSRDLEFLGLPAESDWVLYAPNSFEPIMIHNPFIHQMSRDIGMYSPRTKFVEVYTVTTKGAPVGSASYAGIYVLEEKIKIGKNRVNIDRLDPEDVKAPAVTGGYLNKIDRADPGDSGFVGGLFVDPKEPQLKTAQRAPQKKYITDYYTAFNKALSATTFKDPVLGYAAYIDVDSWINFHVLELLSGNVDTLVLSTYFHKPRNGKIVFGPHWDFDRALGSTDGRDANPRVWSTGPFFSGQWWSKLFTDVDFWQKWVDRWQELRPNQFSRTNINRLIDQLTDPLREAQPRERKKWGTVPRGGTYQTEINFMKTWLSNRIDFVDKQLVQPPQLGAQAGRIGPDFELSIAATPNATIYYTLDGSDPRGFQGVISPKALVYSGPVKLGGNVRVVTRARNTAVRQTGGPLTTTPWSGPVAATFYVSTPKLVVTEIMFNPAPAPAGGTNLSSDFEFIELKNAGTEPANLVGCSFTNGVSFTFAPSGPVTSLAPGQRLLLVKNLAAFQARYPGVGGVAGEYQGNLGNGGNRLALVGPVLEPILDFSYNDNFAPLADGLGFSLVLKDEATPADQLGSAQSWRLSARLGGSPGSPDPAAPALPRVLVNEVLANPVPPDADAVELYNPSPEEADISGWFLSDDFRNPKKYRFPAGTYIAGRNYLVVDETQFGQGADGFGLNADGEETYLFSADQAGNLTGYAHGFPFGASGAGESFGRYVTSDGTERFPIMERPSLGEPNDPPLVGPFVIGEIMFKPLPVAGNAGVNEFVELRNISGKAAPLFDPAHATNTWHLRGAVSFDFPAGAVVPAGGFAVVVGFDPARDGAALGAFQSAYGTDGGAAIYGPWSGRLDNAGETVRLLRPDAPNAAGAVAHVVADEVHYQNGAPWPTVADGSGLSLTRLGLADYGDDSGNWAAEWPSPGDEDSDRDGLPNRWETAHGLNPHSAAGNDGANGDPDGDGVTNLQELRAGTAPDSKGSLLQLRSTLNTGGQFVLSFTASPGRPYSIYYNEGFPTNVWKALATFPASPTATQNSLSEKATNKVRYYRLQTP